MSGPIDDERVRSAITTMRASVFAIASGVVGAMVVSRLHGPIYDIEVPVPFGDPVWLAVDAWAGGLATAILAWVVARGRGEPVMSSLVRSSVAGALDAPACFFALGIVETVRTGEPLSGIRVFLEGLLQSLCAAPIGLFVGSAFGVALLPLWVAHGALGARPTLTTTTSALCVAATWGAAVLGLAARDRALLGAAPIAAALSWISLGIAIVAALETLRRAEFVRRVERGAVDRWRIERHDDGTRWLVREERSGDGAYREGVMSRRWARV